MEANRRQYRSVSWVRGAFTSANLMRRRFTALTVVLVFVMFSASTIDRRDIREFIVSLGLSVLLIFVVWSTGRLLRIVTLALALPTVIGHWVLELSGLVTLRPFVFGVTTVFLAFLTLVVLITVFRDEAVTADTIVGAVCAYFLIGTTWGVAYALLVTLSPGAFSVSPSLQRAVEWSVPSASLQPLLQYYSFTTLATIGYGDITPLTPEARTISVIEGMTGQLYLAVLIARLVGLHTARSSR